MDTRPVCVIAEVVSEEATERCAGLHFSTDAAPGITRRRVGDAFEYTYPDGSRVTDEEELARIRKLAVPPAWTHVWICLDPHGHLQATGRDKRGRKQYRYHADWRMVRDEGKFEHLAAFAEALPAIRSRADEGLRRAKLDREKVLSVVIRLLDETLVRVGNREYARDNDTFGLTTLQERHVDVSGMRVTLAFRGKAGKDVVVGLKDERLARALRRLEELPGQDLFMYLGEDGRPHPVRSDDVNDYLRECTGRDVTAKDFRTWGATVIVAEELYAHGPAPSRKAAEHVVVEAIAEAADNLGNTPAVCRRSYVHPAIPQAYLDGRLTESWKRSLRRKPRAGLRAEERATLDLLKSG